MNQRAFNYTYRAASTHWSKGTNMILAFFIYLFKITFWQKGCLRQLKILKIYYQWSQVQLGLISLEPIFISSKLTSAIEIYGFRWIRSKMPNIQPAHSLDISPTKWAGYLISDQCAFHKNICCLDLIHCASLFFNLSNEFPKSYSQTQISVPLGSSAQQ